VVDRLALFVGSSWFSIGPALVLYLAGVHEPRWRALPIYAAALGAQFVFDIVLTFILLRTAVEISPLTHLRSVLPAFAVDSLLAPLGLLAAFTSYGHPWALLLVLPVLLLFSTFARERQRRIDNALELEDELVGNAYDSDKPHVPSTMAQARERFTSSALARAAFGDEVVDHYTNMADVELAAYGAAVTDWELRRGFERL
jgi:hypothetical protein